MLRVTTLYASSASASAAYYTQYLTSAPGEVPGVWSGAQANGLGLTGDVAAETLQAVLEGRDPVSGTPLGSPLVDRFRADGTVVRAVAGFDATFSAPKSLSVLWALTGDTRVLEVHDQAVSAALAHVERYGATTRVRVNDGRMFPETGGLTMATFRQSTSRADDPQVHTHAVISARVQTDDGRWWALDARYLKRHQRMLGGLYQSALRAGMVERFGVAWGPVVNGQAEVVGVPDELLEVWSKRTAQVEVALADKIAEFRVREGRDPTRWERAALTREAAVDTRARKTGLGVADLMTRWRGEADALGWSPERVLAAVRDHARARVDDNTLVVGEVLDRLSTVGSTWSRADVLRVVCDLAPVRAMSAERWAGAVERVADRVLDACVNLDPTDTRVRRRAGDGRSVWIEPVAGQYTSERILAEEEHIRTWAMDRQAPEPEPSATVEGAGLDVTQAAAARAVAGVDGLVIVEGPAGAGKTTMLRAGIVDLHAHGHRVLGLAPTAKAARVLETETGMAADTIAKLLHEHTRTDRGPFERYRPPAGATLIVDEAGMIGTPTLHRLVELADRHEWRVVLVGDPRQLQAVGRGGLFAELCATGRVHELATIHRFTHPWEAAASLQLRHGDPTAFDTYDAEGRITAGCLDEHLDRLAANWRREHARGRSIAITATSNSHVDAINHAIQAHRIDRGDLDRATGRPIAGGETAHQGDLVATRRNDRTLTTSTGDSVRNRAVWTVTATHPDGSLTVTQHAGHGTIRLPTAYVREHVRLGYAATEHGNQGITTDTGIQLVSDTTTARGLYVGATRGRDHNQFLVITDPDTDPRDVLDRVLASDRADTPAIVHRRTLAAIQLAAVNPEPAPAWTTEPGWLTDWLARLEAQRAQIDDDRRHRDQHHRDATEQLRAMQPALAAARQAWEPYQARIDTLERSLRDELRPAMWSANADARHAGFGHRRATSRRAHEANRAVDEAQASIAAVHETGREIKAHLDQLRTAARRLEDHASHDGYGHLWEQHLLERLERVNNAIDTWRLWNTGQRGTIDDLADALDTLIGERHQAPALAVYPDQVTSRLLDQLVEPLASWLADTGLRAPGRQHEPDHYLSLDL